MCDEGELYRLTFEDTAKVPGAGGDQDVASTSRPFHVGLQAQAELLLQSYLLFASQGNRPCHPHGPLSSQISLFQSNLRLAYPSPKIHDDNNAFVHIVHSSPWTSQISLPLLRQAFNRFSFRPNSAR